MARSIVAALAFWLLLVPGASFAVDSAKPPRWSELNPEQKQILSPVANNWDDMSARKRFKLLGVAKHYLKMTPLEQQRVGARHQTLGDGQVQAQALGLGQRTRARAKGKDSTSPGSRPRRCEISRFQSATSLAGGAGTSRVPIGTTSLTLRLRMVSPRQ